MSEQRCQYNSLDENNHNSLDGAQVQRKIATKERNGDDDEEALDKIANNAAENADSNVDKSSLIEIAEVDVTNFVQKNPIMDRVRLTLREQLLQTRDRVRLELKEQEDELKKAKREREDVGIELYGVQQQLARLQANLGSIDKRYDEVSKERMKEQEKVATVKKRYEERVKEAEKLGKIEAKVQEELDTMLQQVRQTKKYNEETKSEAAVARTVANKTEEHLKANAKDKLMQDNYTDSLNHQVTSLEDDIALTEAQLCAQKDQSSESDKMIRETRNALEKLASEQRRLIQQWNSSVVALSRRDQALSASKDALKKIQDSIKDVDNENARFRMDIKALENDSERLKAMRDRLENEIIFTESNIAKVQSNLGSLSEKFQLIQESLHNTIQDEKEVDAEMKKIQSDMESVSHKCELLIRERQSIEEKIITGIHERASVSKTAQNLAKEEKAILAKIYEREIESASILNEIARLDLRRFNTQAHNTQLEEKLNDELNVLKAAEAKIHALEGEIKHRNDELENTSRRVVKLNQEYNKMLDAYEGEEPTGPLEITIKSLSKEIEQEGSRIRSLQKEWLICQTELIKVTRKTSVIQEEDSKCIARLSVLEQKALRVTQHINTNESALKSLEANIRGMHTDITRLNDLIEHNTRQRTDLADKLAVDAMEFEKELAGIKEESVSLEVKIADTHKNHANLLDQIREIESQIHHFEQKIQVEKETQAELSTSKDVIDMKGMQKEINKMKHRIESLARIQEQLLRDMELAIKKREDIAVKYKNTKYHSNSQRYGLTKGEMAKKVEMTTLRLKRLDDSLLDASSTMAKIREDQAAVHLLLTDVEAKYESTRNQTDILQREVDTRNLERHRLQLMCELQDELFKRYDALSQNKLHNVEYSKREEVSIERELEASTKKLNKVTNIVSDLALKHERCKQVFDKLNLLATNVLIGDS